jgi:uncharacterized ferritin-like protein (DUF455 family)
MDSNGSTNRTIKHQQLFRQILCGGLLSDKLLGEQLRFEQIEWTEETFDPTLIPELPGRAFAGSIQSSTGISAFPKKSKLILENEEGYRERGRLLHYFANHELLAIETMALTLLRFPEAPLEFKRGVFKTLQDEQRHMKLYLERMNEYGVALGDVPFSYYFWNRLRDMKSPLDFVVRMSMTFEQANLDFALEFAKLFEGEMDDVKTASLLKQVHDDEVKHVGHGLKWFKEWNHDEIEREGEWGAYLHQLPYPLNARRAKGSVFFSDESRLEAGFSKEYVDSIRIAGGSRGRVPDYYLFNPECEIEVGIPDLPKVLREKIEDLAPVMLWLAHGEDVVELPSIPSIEFQKQMFEYRGELPEMVTETEASKGLPARYELIESIKPWGWGRRAWARDQGWFKQVRKHPSFTESDFKDRYFSKAYWKKFLSENAPALVQGQVISSLGEFQSWLSSNSDSDQDFIFKLSKSTSGRGHVVFKPSVIDTEVKKLLQKKDLEGVLEPYFEKLADFSVQYEILDLPEGKKIRKFDPRFFMVDDQLQYLGSWLGPIPQTHELFPAWQAIERQRAVMNAAHDLVLKHLLSSGYVGPVGIDALVARMNGELQVVPVIEVNVRYTMGRVAHAIEADLRKKGYTGSAQMLFHTKQELKRKQHSSFPELASQFSPGTYFQVTPLDSAKSTWVAVHLSN